jgi:thioredoxin reductase
MSPIYPRVRVANFSEITATDHATITIETDSVVEVVAQLRRYTDLPYVFILPSGLIDFVTAVLAELKAIRSPCYPHALFILGEKSRVDGFPDLAVHFVDPEDADSLDSKISEAAQSALVFDKSLLAFDSSSSIPEKVDVLIVGGGITAMFAAEKLRDRGLSFCIAEKKEIIGGIWSNYANITSQVNTSEGAYRLFDHETRTNRDHSFTAEILKDIYELASRAKDRIYTKTTVEKIAKRDSGYMSILSRNGEQVQITSRGVILAINDRVGTPRAINWQGEELFQGVVVSGHSDETSGIDWNDKRVVVVGMGAFAVENVRTALEAGAKYVTVVCRRHGTVCPKIIDYLNFSTPYNDRFEHDRKSNIRNMMLWKKLYELSGATEPECWMGKIKHTGHTISVSDLWFIAHHLKKMETVTGSVSALYDSGVIVNDDTRIEADIVVKCVGFHRNASSARSICGYSEMYSNNYIDKDFMYLADAYIDDNAFNSFFGSSVLEMTKFYLDVFLEFYGKSDFQKIIAVDGIEKIDIENRSWSHYINGASALIRAFPRLHESAKTQVDRRSADFHEIHDLETYIDANRREWIDAHSQLAGRTLREEECLPYVFDRLAEKKIP